MGSNKKIKNKMIKKYGRKCMIEELGIRYIPSEEMRTIEGYKKSDEELTYHHIFPKSKGGRKTEENGALIKAYNHKWLENLPQQERDKINQELQEYKARINACIVDSNLHVKTSTTLEFNSSDCVVIPLYNNKEVELER